MPRPQKQSRSESYSFLAAESAKLGEQNDCTVIALALACDAPYAEAHAVLAELGRKPGRGIYFNGPTMHAAVARFGFKAERVNLCDLIATYPGAHARLKSVTTHHPDRFAAVWPEGTFLMFTAGHVLCIKNGLNHDHTRGRAKRAVSLFKIVKG